MMEVLTPEMQAEYCESMSAANWRAMLNSFAAAQAIA
jgi:hypothetical protein